MLQLNTTPVFNRVNPAEMRALRALVEATTICCPDTATQSAVTVGSVTLQQTWSEEGLALKAERELLALRQQQGMKIIR